ncbi:hypothetical protein Bcav_2972 [Beutenbergia cavernae DSM 12333]|uniref:Aldose 1-epimerase n=1 Tax=Beutenbergia cavernae (strain ATCC BAA-8 / DSM 12333 / CCUG 43141 / JCM 11478 / NBRC 16432 / NCIMB 13614 / HKI 0122) TaxID=471853 RepID=C5BZN7_BEUC1|nr:hypothetical protein [Beutenbergia cavernae]ACQ81217.1 hypothetical protein Bcav_2972 [Beutenbergia cavernae DSM 12333]
MTLDDAPTPSPAAPEIDGPWVRPSAAEPAEPRWGHADGLQIGLHPLRGPRGLLRVYAPYLGHARDRVVNFVAVEPIPAGETRRGYSELEPSELDGVAGKRFWSCDDADQAASGEPLRPDAPARGVVETRDGVARLSVYVGVEPFANGSRVHLRLTFRADAPHEVTIATYAAPSSAPLDSCIVTATMGNYARLRRLELADRVVTPAELWPDLEGAGFAPHARFPLGELRRDANGDVVVDATPDEADPSSATYAAAVAEHWKYTGALARQTWRADDPDPGLQAYVNGRRAYWASTAPIPGGTAYENVELVEPFRQGREFTFAVEPLA